MHIKNDIAEARNLLGSHVIKHFPPDNSKLAKMEFYLVDDLECDLIVFHPYRTLVAFVNEQRSSEQSNLEKKAREMGMGILPRYHNCARDDIVLRPLRALQGGFQTDSKSGLVYSIWVERMDAICTFACPGHGTSRSTSHGTATTPSGDGGRRSTPGATGLEVDSKFLIALMNKMRAMRELDVVHPPTGRPVTVSRMLKGTQQ